MIEQIPLTADTESGNNTHPSKRTDANETLAFEFEVLTAGGTPTVTWKIQGSLDNATFYDVLYVTDATDTASAAARVATAAGVQIQFLSNPVARRYKHYRLVTSANTNITYKARAYRISKP